MIVITGASGQLGRLVIKELLETTDASQIVAAVRNPTKVDDLAALGVSVRVADYDQPATLETAFAGADKLLLISSSEVGRRTGQHQAVIDAAKRAGIGLLAYTSILHADTSPLALAREHRETEALIAASSRPAVILRNGWYTENYTAGIPGILERGLLQGAAGQGRIASAPRRDYAAAAARVLTTSEQAGQCYELAGDHGYTLEELTTEISRQSGKTVSYQNLSGDEYKRVLCEVGLPEPLADILADAEVGAAGGALYDSGKALSRLIGRPTGSMPELVQEALA